MTGPSRRSQIVARTALAMVVLGLGLTMCASPRAAETEKTFEVWAVRSGRYLSETQPNWERINTLPVYASKTECDHAILAVKLDRFGWRLTCRRTEGATR